MRLDMMYDMGQHTRHRLCLVYQITPHIVSCVAMQEVY
jgi:hypothetical protein